MPAQVEGNNPCWKAGRSRRAEETGAGQGGGEGGGAVWSRISNVGVAVWEIQSYPTQNKHIEINYLNILNVQLSQHPNKTVICLTFF